MFSWDKLFRGIAIVAVGIAAAVVVASTFGAALAPMAALTVAVTATASVGCMAFGCYDIIEGVTDLNPVKKSIGEQLYDTIEFGCAAAATTGASFIINGTVSVDCQNTNDSYDNQGNDYSGKEIDELSRSQVTRINELNNIINDHLTDKDFSGLIKELNGEFIYKSNGEFYNHIHEVSDAYTGLEKVANSLANSLKNPNLSEEIRNFIQKEYDRAVFYMDKINSIFEQYGESKWAK